jgi:hypothetical protein
LRHCFLDEAADVRQAGVGSARTARLNRRRVRIQANDARALVRLNAGGFHSRRKQLKLKMLSPMHPGTSVPNVRAEYEAHVRNYECQL